MGQSRRRVAAVVGVAFGLGAAFFAVATSPAIGSKPPCFLAAVEESLFASSSIVIVRSGSSTRYIRSVAPNARKKPGLTYVRVGKYRREIPVSTPNESYAATAVARSFDGKFVAALTNSRSTGTSGLKIFSADGKCIFERSFEVMQSPFMAVWGQKGLTLLSSSGHRWRWTLEDGLSPAGYWIGGTKAMDEAMADEIKADMPNWAKVVLPLALEEVRPTKSPYPTSAAHLDSLMSLSFVASHGMASGRALDLARRPDGTIVALVGNGGVITVLEIAAFPHSVDKRYLVRAKDCLHASLINHGSAIAVRTGPDAWTPMVYTTGRVTRMGSGSSWLTPQSEKPKLIFRSLNGEDGYSELREGSVAFFDPIDSFP